MHRQRLRFGFPDRGHEPYGSDRWRGDIALIAGFLERSLGEDGLPAYEYRPVTGEQTADGFVGRRIHALWALDEAGRILENADWREAAGSPNLRYQLSHGGYDGAPQSILTLRKAARLAADAGGS